MNGYGYESLVWIRDDSGKEFYCPIEAVRENFTDGDELNNLERAACTDVNQLIGTERW